MPAGTLPAQRGPRSTARGPFISGRYSYSISIPARVCDPPRPTARGYVHQGRPPGRAAHGPPGATRAQLDGHQENRIKAHGPRPGAGLRARLSKTRELRPTARAPPGRSSRARPGGHQAPATAHATRTTAHGPPATIRPTTGQGSRATGPVPGLRHCGGRADVMRCNGHAARPGAGLRVEIRGASTLPARFK